MNKKIYYFLIKNDINIDEDLFYYGWSIFMHYSIYLILTFLLSIYLNCCKLTIIFLLLYIPLRKYIGGFHFSNNVLCILFSIMVSLIFPYMSMNLIINFKVAILLELFLLIETIFIAPIDHINKRLTMTQIQMYKRKSILIEFIYICFSMISHICLFNEIINILFFVILVNMISLSAAYVRKLFYN